MLYRRAIKGVTKRDTRSLDCFSDLAKQSLVVEDVR